jgi:hypothetical protein
MSKIKTPRQKKQLSLERDRRNAYREDSKASRKNIARGKQRRHMDERRAVAQVLSGLKGKVEEGVAANAELQVKVSVADSRNRGFRKVPDEPPGVHLILHARNRRNKGGTTA